MENERRPATVDFNLKANTHNISYGRESSIRISTFNHRSKRDRGRPSQPHRATRGSTNQKRERENITEKEEEKAIAMATLGGKSTHT